MTARTFGDFWNHWRAQNGMPPLKPRPWPPEPYISPVAPPAPAQRPKRRPRQVLGQVTRDERPCRCGSTDFIIGQGKGPHVARLMCKACGRLRRWIGRRELERA
jgi:hypothetical protein